jgi:diguanylate cyclase (GGDEF)-like protein
MDRHSYFLALALAYGCAALLLAVSGRPRTSSPARMLVLAYAAIAVAAFLQGEISRLPFVVSTVAGNVLAWLGLLAQAWAILDLAGRPITRRGRWVAGGVLMGIVVVLLAVPPTPRFAGSNLVYAGLFVYTAWCLSTWSEAKLALRRVTAALFVAAGLLYVVRAANFLIGDVAVSAAGVPELRPWVTDFLLPMSFTALMASAFGLLLLSRQVTEVRLEEATRELARLAAYDDLTGLPNRRYLLDRARAECARAARSGHPLCIAVMDLDRLKAINDGFGHAAGDRALRTLAEAAIGALREQDMAARTGGDEFAVLLPDSDLGQARAAMGRMLAVLSSREFDGTDPLTASVGVIQYRPGESVDDAFARADAAMYASKRAGGGTVVAFTVPDAPPLDSVSAVDDREDRKPRD